MNVQASQEETDEAEFEDQEENDVTLIGLSQQHFVPIHSQVPINNRAYFMNRNHRLKSADEADSREPAPYGEGEMPNNVRNLDKSEPKKEFKDPVPVWG